VETPEGGLARAVGFQPVARLEQARQSKHHVGDVKHALLHFLACPEEVGQGVVGLCGLEHHIRVHREHELGKMGELRRQLLRHVAASCAPLSSCAAAALMRPPGRRSHVSAVPACATLHQCGEDAEHERRGRLTSLRVFVDAKLFADAVQKS
jgi:hypothetical protein